MLIVDTIAKIRRLFREHRSIREISRELRLSRKVVRKALRSDKLPSPTSASTSPVPSLMGAAARRSLYLRSAAVRRYVLARAGGICESCDEPAPFATLQGEPYLEPHHTRHLSDGGPDTSCCVGAVCPSCHREIHHGRHGHAKNEVLIEVIRQKETASGAWLSMDETAGSWLRAGLHHAGLLELLNDCLYAFRVARPQFSTDRRGVIAAESAAPACAALRGRHRAPANGPPRHRQAAHRGRACLRHRAA